jgi:hypothetical protein
MRMMKRHRAAKVLMVLAFVTVVIGVFGLAVLQLWNWLMPVIFGLHAITFGQALGLMALSWILFGGFRGRGFRGRWRRDWDRGMRARWEQMTPEQREAFRQGLRGGCGHFDPPAAETKA